MQLVTTRPVWQRFITSLLLFFSTFAYASPLKNNWQSLTYIEDAFAEITFKREYKRGAFRLNKWLKPIHYQIHYAYIKGPYPPAETLLKAHLSDLSQITGLKILPVGTQGHKKSNLDVYFTKDRFLTSAL